MSLEEYKVVTQDFVNICITNSGQQTFIGNERRFQKGLTIIQLKGKLELMTGGNTATMKLELYSKDDKFICDISDNDALLGSYPIEDGMRIHVVDNFSLYNDFDSAKVEKFELSADQYAKKNDTVKSFLKKNKLGKYNEEEMKKRKEQQAKDIAEEEKLVRDIIVGSRCLVTTPSAPERKGVIMFTGKMDGRQGYWVGVKYDEPLGKNDGTCEGKKYFECESKYGGFVKPMYVTIGNFPEEDYDLNEEI